MMKRACYPRDSIQGDETLLSFLRVRAWIAHLFLAFFFATRWVSTDWDHIEELTTDDQAETCNEKADDCSPKQYNVGLIFLLKPYLRVILGGLAFISLILCLIVCKWRHRADYLLIFNLVYMSFATLPPLDFYSRTDYSLFVNSTIVFMLFYTQHKA